MEVLITGNIAMATKEMIKTAFPHDHITLIGEQQDYISPQERQAHEYISISSTPARKLLQSNHYSVVVYLSGYLGFHRQDKGEMEDLNSLLDGLVSRSRGYWAPRVIYINSLDAISNVETADTVILRSCELLCDYYRLKKKMQIRIIRSPYLVQLKDEQDYFHNIFEQFRKKGQISFEESPSQQCALLDQTDLADFLYRYLEHWNYGWDRINLFPQHSGTIEEIGQALLHVNRRGKILYQKNKLTYENPGDYRPARKYYGWYPKKDLLNNMKELYLSYCAMQARPKSRMERIAEMLHNLQSELGS
ncbi:MAG: hypothetical protein PHC41_03680 [Lachnospiraceae bacterium]|nr:hypothetical protein [Lachnospiraceae bacterium]MDD3615308.1 hypothetical protein [Lachnospiraceae bacterium]